MKGLLAKDTTLMSIIILAIILIYASFSWLCPIMIDDYMLGQIPHRQQREHFAIAVGLLQLCTRFMAI